MCQGHLKECQDLLLCMRSNDTSHTGCKWLIMYTYRIMIKDYCGKTWSTIQSISSPRRTIITQKHDDINWWSPRSVLAQAQQCEGVNPFNKICSSNTEISKQ
jgi:hypothetical protein